MAVNETPLVMLLDDDMKYARMLELELSDDNYASRHISPSGYAEQTINYTPSDVVDEIIASGASLAIFSLGESSLAFEEIYAQLRSRSNLPCLFLYRSASQIEPFRTSGQFVDDALLLHRPFETEKLLAMVRRAVAISYADSSGVDKLIYIDGLVINEASHTVTYKDTPVELTRKEYDLLRFLSIRRGSAISRREIFVKVWGFDYYGDTNVVDVYIRYLRAKIDARFGVKIIHTVRGVGYCIR